jgi:hypothetical protein
MPPTCFGHCRGHPKGGALQRTYSVCMCVYIYIYTHTHTHTYIYIYIQETGLVLDRLVLYSVYPSHHPAGREGRSESGQILCSNVTRTWTGSTISRGCTFVVPWNNYGLQVIRTAHTHSHTCTLNWRLMDQNYHAWELRGVELTSGSRFWYEYIICGVATSSHTHSVLPDTCQVDLRTCHQCRRMTWKFQLASASQRL